MTEPEKRESETQKIIEREERGNVVGYAAIKYAAIVIIVLAILYFLAAFVIPLFKA